MERNYIASNILFLRKKAKMTQTEFGKTLGLSRAIISGYETGVRSPVLDDVFTLADHFNVSVETLLTRDMDSPLADTQLTNAQVKAIAEIIKELK